MSQSFGINSKSGMGRSSCPYRLRSGIATRSMLRRGWKGVRRLLIWSVESRDERKARI